MFSLSITVYVIKSFLFLSELLFNCEYQFWIWMFILLWKSAFNQKYFLVVKTCFQCQLLFNCENLFSIWTALWKSAFNRNYCFIMKLWKYAFDTRYCLVVKICFRYKLLFSCENLLSITNFPVRLCLLFHLMVVILNELIK